MPNAFDVLARDHEQVKQMLARFESVPTAAAGVSEEQLAMRKKMADELVIAESRHEAAEEMYFWPAVRQRVQGGDQLADTAIGQEQEAKGLLSRLDKLDPRDQEFESLLTDFITAGREHIAFEETEVWPALRAALSGPESAELAGKLEQAKHSTPTRPHPHAPAAPGVLKTAGPALSAADRLRDSASGRGQD